MIVINRDVSHGPRPALEGSLVNQEKRPFRIKLLEQLHHEFDRFVAAVKLFPNFLNTAHVCNVLNSVRVVEAIGLKLPSQARNLSRAVCGL